MVILLLIPYHAAQAFTTWGEGNYVYFFPDRAVSSVIIFFAPFLMQLLFVFAGMSTKFALTKRTYGQYLTERVKRLLVPLVFCVVTLMPAMTYLADRANCGYAGGFFAHYAIFFTKITDLSGFDGAFSFGQFWFLLYLFGISVVALGIIVLQKRFLPDARFDVPVWALVLLGLPLPILRPVLAVGGKSFAEFLYLFLTGYFVFSNDAVSGRIEKYRWLWGSIAVAAVLFNLVFYLETGAASGLWHDIASYVAGWFMILALIGFGPRCLSFHGPVSAYFSGRSFLVFSLHFLAVVLLQYCMRSAAGMNVAVLYFAPVILAYVLTLTACEVVIRVPVLRFLFGVKGGGKHDGKH